LGLIIYTMPGGQGPQHFFCESIPRFCLFYIRRSTVIDAVSKIFLQNILSLLFS